MAIPLFPRSQPSDESRASGSRSSPASSTNGSFQACLTESHSRLKNTALPPHAIRSMFKFSSGNPLIPVSIDDIELELNETMLSFRYYINQIFEAMDFGSPVELKSDPYGNICVSNYHPERTRIEKVFNENTDLRAMSIKIMALADLVESSHEAIAFQEAYRNNPQAAITRYYYLFNEKQNINRFYINLLAKDGLWSVYATPERLFKFRFNVHSSGDLIQPTIDDFWVKWNLEK